MRHGCGITEAEKEYNNILRTLHGYLRLNRKCNRHLRSILKLRNLGQLSTKNLVYERKMDVIRGIVDVASHINERDILRCVPRAGVRWTRMCTEAGGYFEHLLQR
jgi:hypothetical protein